MNEATSFEPVFAKIESKARADGAEVELLIERAEKFAVSFQAGQPEKFDSSATHCAGLRVIANGYPGYSYTENLSETAVLEAYQQALENAHFTALGGDPTQKIALASDTTAVPESIDLFNESLAGLSMETKLARGRELEARALAVDGRVSSVPYNQYAESESEVQIFNSKGLRRRQRYTSVVGYAYCLAKSGEESRMAGESAFSRDGSHFDAKKIAEEGAKLALAKLGASPPETGHYPVVIDAKVMQSLIGQIAGDFSAQSVFEKSSIFMNDRGQMIASPKVTIVDDPFLKGGAATRNFDGEGIASKTTPLIQNGVLSNFLTNSVFALRMNLPHTASADRSARSELGIGTSNVVMKPGTRSLEELLKTYPKVIYITEFSGFHAGYQHGSGDFSLQSEGELWENGQRIRPLCNFVTAGNIRRLLQDIEEVSSRVLPIKGSVIAPDVLVKSLSIAGK